VNEANSGETVFVRRVCVCVQRTGQSDQFKTVKATDFKFDMHVPRDSPDRISKKSVKKGAWPGSRDPLSFDR